nr:capsid protein [Gyrovirus galga1]WIC83148.1 VP1 [Gyrovirus galga1]
MARLRRRRPRGRFGFYHRGRWHWRHRLRRRRYSRRGKFGYARRRSFDRRVKRRIFNPHPGSYVVRLPNPYNKLTLFFQGIVFIPEAQAFVKSTYTKTNLTVCHVASINVNLREFMLATMPLDAKSKIGGPNPYPQHLQGCQWSAQTTQDAWPYSAGRSETKRPSVPPSEWWRWALLVMHPRAPGRFYNAPKLMTLDAMGDLLGGWQLFRHVKTKFRVLATMGQGAFSPVASLLVQNDYWSRRHLEGFPVKGAPPMCTMQRKTQQYGNVESNAPADEQWLPVNPPDPPQYPNQQGCSQNVAPGIYRLAGLEDSSRCFYSKACFPSFAALSAMGAPWSFPSTQKPIQRGSFNKHSITGTGDPQGRRWLTLVPKGVEWITDDTMEPTQLDTDIATLFLAQGSPVWAPYKFGTFHKAMALTAMQTTPWCVVKVRSIWQLGNQRQPYPWQVNWYNEHTATDRYNP